MFDAQPTLVGERLVLRPMRAEDYDALYEAARDPLIWEQHPSRDRYQPDVFRAFFDEGLASGGALVAIDRQTDRLIGSSRFANYDPERSEIEIGWTFLARAYWGGIYNGEMKRLMLSHAFRFVRTVVFLVGPRNFRSQRAVEKLGAVRVSTRTDAQGRVAYVYALTADAFLGGNEPRVETTTTPGHDAS
jgi:RimJ/RimL family protein N-acetyltransferase